jgi:DNA-binding NtrC family response regulator
MERLVIMAPGAAIDEVDLPNAAAATNAAADLTLDAARRGFERDFLAARLAAHGGNISRTAEAVGIKRETLSRKLKALGIAVPRG